MDYEALRGLHQLLRQRADLEEQLARCPRTIHAARLKSEQLDKAVEDAKAAWQKCQKDVDSKQMTLRQRETRIKQLQERRNSCDSNKEFQLLSEQIEADLKANSVLEDEILEMIERVEVLHQDVKNARDAAADGQRRFQQVQKETEAKAAELREKIANLTDKIRDGEKLFAGEQLQSYLRRVEANAADALAETDGHSCGNCHTLITTQILSELRQRKPVSCKSCGAILYMLAASPATAGDA